MAEMAWNFALEDSNVSALLVPESSAKPLAAVVPVIPVVLKGMVQEQPPEVVAGGEGAPGFPVLPLRAGFIVVAASVAAVVVLLHSQLGNLQLFGSLRIYLCSIDFLQTPHVCVSCSCSSLPSLGLFCLWGVVKI